MAFPAPESVRITDFPSLTTTHNVLMPATVNAGDYLVCFIQLLEADFDVIQASTPTNWTFLSHGSVAGEAGLTVFYKVADGTEDGASVNFATGTNTAGLAVVYRVSGATDIEVGTSATGASSTHPNPPSVTASWGSADNLWLAVCTSYDIDGSISAYPTNFTGGRQDRGTFGEAYFGTAIRANATATEDPGVFTRTGAQPPWVAQTVVFKPAADVPKAFSDAGAEGTESLAITEKRKAYADSGAEGAESFAVSEKSKAFADSGEEGSESFIPTKPKAYSDAGAEGTESFSPAKPKAYSDAGAEGTEDFSKEVQAAPEFAFDTFTDTNSALIQDHTSDSGHDWIKRDQMSTNNFDIQSNKAHFTTPSASVAYDGYDIDLEPGQDEYDVEIQGSVTGASLGVNDGLTIFTRRNSNPATRTFYRLNFSGNGDFRLRRYDAGSPTNLANTTQTFNSGQTYKLRLHTRINESGNVVLEAYLDDSLVLTHTDTSGSKITSRGRGGFGALGSTTGGREIVWDNFNMDWPLDKAYSDAGAAGAEIFAKSIIVQKAYSDAGAEGAELFTANRLKTFADAGAEGMEAYVITQKEKAFADAGAEGAELFSKTRFINPTYLKNRFEVVTIQVID